MAISATGHPPLGPPLPAAPAAEVCRLTGNPDAKTRATAIQALTEMGERGACFDEEVFRKGPGTEGTGGGPWIKGW